MKSYDLIIIGAGSGTKLVHPCIAKKKKVAIIEKSKMGGTCLNRGCIPSKMLIHPADVAFEIGEAAKFDIAAKKGKVNFAKLTSRISRTVDGESAGIKKWYENNKDVDYYPHEARFVSNKVLEVNGKKITAKKIVIAVGARPSIPPIEGLKGTPFMTSTEALRSKKLPRKLVVLGGGYIATELGYAYGALGSKVTFLVRGTDMVKMEDQEVQEEFKRVFTKQFDVRFNTCPSKVSYKNGQFHLEITKGKKKSVMKADGLLVATGVRTNSDLLGLENTSVKLRGPFVKVNKHMETSVKGVYAIGDVAGNYLFRHSANFEAEYFIDRHLLKRHAKPISYPPMPHAIFTQPQVAGVGVTEQELIAKGKKEGKDYVKGVNPYSKSAMGMARLSDSGFVKLLVDKKSRRIIGAHAIGYESSTLVHQLIQLMTKKGTIDDMLSMIYIHPALSEIVRNAARIAMAKL